MSVKQMTIFCLNFNPYLVVRANFTNITDKIANKYDTVLLKFLPIHIAVKQNR